MSQIINAPKECLQATSHQGTSDRKLKNFIFPIGMKEIQKKVIRNVNTYDFHIAAIIEEKDTPQFFYTIGLYYQYQHPELLIMGLDINVAKDILMRAYEFIKNGGTIAPWTTLETFSSMPLKAIPIHASDYRQFLGFGMWFYRSLQGPQPDSFSAIQLLY